MKHRWFVIGCLAIIAQTVTAKTTLGVDSVNSDFFREWYQWGELNHYLDNLSDYTVYEAETTGEWSLPEQQVFSICGNSFRWNKYYYQGFRIDSRFQEGGTLLYTDMQEHSLSLDYERGRLYFTPDSQRSNAIRLSGNVGGAGGISPGTAQMIHWFHKTASDRAIKPITERAHILGSGQLSAGYGIPYKGRTLYQHLYAHYGQRRQVACDETGISGTYDAPYYKVQLTGELPMPQGLWSLHYLLSTQHRTDLYSEYTYAPQEQATQTNYSLSIYTKRGTSFTTGLTYALHDILHNNRTFERNIIDQDGEGLEPWYADGKTHELSWAVNYQLPILSWLSFRLDAYNSLVHFRPAATQWTNRLYAQYADSARTDYYDYCFSSQPFTTGLLENEARLEAQKTLLPWLTMRGGVALTLDGILLRDKQLVMPSWEAEFALAFHPVKWFRAEVILGNYRTRYGLNMAQLLSSDYLNADIRYVGSGRQANRRGGAYISIDKGFQQPQYAVLDIPIRFTIANQHEIAILSTARKYYNCQSIQYAESVPNGETGAQYILTRQPVLREAGFFYNTPLYLSNTIRYTYHGRKVFFSLSWQSYQMSGTSLIGNGVLANNVDALSYTMADAATCRNANNPTSPVRSLGRLDQDRAYICRMQMGANITPNWGLSANFHFKDGTPICNYLTEETTTAQGDKDLIIYPGDTKGINVSDGHFGRRKDAFFNLDIRLRYRGNINMRNQTLGAPGAIPFEVQLTGYNLYDFGTELLEYNFDQYLPQKRNAMTLCIPRGFALHLRIGLSQNRP